MPAERGRVTRLSFAWMCEDAVLILLKPHTPFKLIAAYVRAALIGLKLNWASVQERKTSGLLVISLYRRGRFSHLRLSCALLWKLWIDAFLLLLFLRGDGGCVSRRQPTARENHPHFSASDRLSHPTRTEWMRRLRGSPSLAATRSGGNLPAASHRCM